MLNMLALLQAPEVAAAVPNYGWLGAGEMLDEIPRMIVADVLQCIRDALNEEFLLDDDHVSSCVGGANYGELVPLRRAGIKISKPLRRGNLDRNRACLPCLCRGAEKAIR